MKKVKTTGRCKGAVIVSLYSNNITTKIHELFEIEIKKGINNNAI